MAIVSRLTAKTVRQAPFAHGNSYYIMEGRSRRSLRGFGIRVYRTKKEYVVRFRGNPHHIGSASEFLLRSPRRPSPTSAEKRIPTPSIPR